MSRTLTLGALAVLGAALSAQSAVQVAGETLTKLDSMVTFNNTNDQDDVAAQTKFTRMVMSKAGVRGGHTGNQAEVGMHHDWRTRKTMHFASLMTHGSLYGMQASDTGAAMGSDGAKTPGPMMVKFVFAAPKDTKGNFMVHLGGMASENGKVELAAKIDKRTLTWKKGEKPLVVEIKDYVFAGDVEVELWAMGGATLKGKAREHFSGKAFVSFVPAVTGGSNCKVEAGPANCGGKLEGKVASSSPMGHRIDCALTGAAKDALGVVLLSPDGKTATIPSTTCDLFTNVNALLAIIRTDANGDAKHMIQVPGNKKLEFWAMDALLGFGSSGLTVTTSNWLKITCQ